MEKRYNIPLGRPWIDEDEIAAVTEVLLSGWLTKGDRVGKFEDMIKDFQRCDYAVAVNSATSALHLAAVILGIGRGDEVIVPAFTYPATANAMVHAGAKPVFVDITLRDFNINVSRIEEKITENTKAIVPVHLFGYPADMYPILELAKQHNLKVIEDAACSLGTTYKGRKVGTLGDCGAFSLHPRKCITTGEGGMLTTNNKDISNTAILLRSHGEKGKGRFVFAGYNYRMTEIQAAVGIEQMKKVFRILDQKRLVAKKYTDFLSDLNHDYILLPLMEEGHTYQSYVIVIEDRVKRTRGEIISKLAEKGVFTHQGTYNVPGTEYYACDNGDFPNSRKAGDRTLVLPLYIGITDDEIEHVSRSLRLLLCS